MEWPHFSRLLAFAGAGLAPAGCIPNSSPMTMGQPTFVRPVLQAGSHVSELSATETVCVKSTQTSFSISTGSGFSKAGKKWFRGKVLNKSFQARCRSKVFPGEVPPAKSAKFPAKQGSEGRCEGKVLKQGMFPGFSHVQVSEQVWSSPKPDSPRTPQRQGSHQVPERRLLKDNTKCQRQCSQLLFRS